MSLLLKLPIRDSTKVFLFGNQVLTHTRDCVALKTTQPGVPVFGLSASTEMAQLGRESLCIATLTVRKIIYTFLCRVSSPQRCSWLFKTAWEHPLSLAPFFIMWHTSFPAFSATTENFQRSSEEAETGAKLHVQPEEPNKPLFSINHEASGISLAWVPSQHQSGWFLPYPMRGAVVWFKAYEMEP